MAVVISGGNLATKTIKAFEQTFVQLSDILTALGTTRTALWPFLESNGSLVQTYKNTPHELEALEAGINGFDPFRHEGGVFSYLFNTGGGTYLLGEDHGDFESANAAGNDDAAFSVGMWIQPHDITSVTLMAKYDVGTQLREWKIELDSSNKLEFEIFDENVDGTEIGASTTAITINTWSFVCVTYDGVDATPGVAFYLNGTADGTGTTDSSYTSMERTATQLTIGAHLNSGIPTQIFDGRMALPFICGKELSAANVSTIYEAGRNLLGV